MIGGAGGAFEALFSDYDFYYSLFKKTLATYPFASAIDLDIEETVELKDVQRLIRDIHNDYPNMQIVLTPLAGSLSQDGPGMGGFSYKDLWCSPEGGYISWFNAQAYGDLTNDELNSIVQNGYPVDIIVMGMLGTQLETNGDFPEICNELIKCVSQYKNKFGGVFIWEYYDQPGHWLETMYTIIHKTKYKKHKTITRICSIQ